MPRIQGVGPRIAARIIEMGYVRGDGKPDVRRFARAFDYDKTLVYEWIADRRTPTKEVDRLCADLQVSHGWLLYGEGRPARYKPVVPIAGAADRPATPSVVQLLENILLIRSWLVGLVQPLLHSPVTA